MVGVGVGQYYQVNSSIPEGHFLAQPQVYCLWVRATVDKDVLMSRGLNQDGVSFAYIQKADMKIITFFLVLYPVAIFFSNSLYDF